IAVTERFKTSHLWAPQNQPLFIWFVQPKHRSRRTSCGFATTETRAAWTITFLILRLPQVVASRWALWLVLDPLLRALSRWALWLVLPRQPPRAHSAPRSPGRCRAPEQCAVATSAACAG